MYLESLLQAQLLWINTIKVHIYFGQTLLNDALCGVKSLQLLTKDLSAVTQFPEGIHYVALKQVAMVICPIIVTYSVALMTAIQITLLRVAITTLFIPFFILLSAISMVDGLVQHYLRRINGGRESALIYHHTRNAILPVLFIGCGLYVALPFSIAPQLIILPSAVLCALLIFFATKTFKKYL
jgi:integrating conjugative element membrane protein (TIGR03747 family)